MLLLWQNGVQVDDASFAGCGRGFAGCGLTSAWFRSGRGALTAGEVVERIKGRVGIPWMTETVDRNCCRRAGGAGEGDCDDDDGDA